MSIVVLAEKPSISRTLASQFQAQHPGKPISFVHNLWFGHLKRRYPKGLKLSAYPHLQQPIFNLASADLIDRFSFTLLPDGNKIPCTAEEMLPEATELYVVCDPEPSSVFHAITFLALAAPGMRNRAKIVRPYAFDANSVAQALSTCLPFSAIEHVFDQGYVKAYLDFNWNTNSFAVLGQALSAVGVDSAVHPMSKHALQLLYWLEPLGPLTESRILWHMRSWVGTGKYKPTRMGSEASAYRILQNLQESGLVRRVSPDSRDVVVSQRGSELLARLHKDCQDLDLPARIEQWLAAGPSAIPAIDRYIRTFFGKQLRHARV